MLGDRSRKHVLAVLVSTTALVLGATASAAQRTVDARLTVTGSGTSWTLTFRNASGATGPVRCWRYAFPPGVNALAITQPPGDWQVGATTPAPAAVLGGRSTTGIPPGGAAAFGVRTDRAFDTAGPAGTAAVSEDCVSDSPAPVDFGSQPPPPPPPPKPCRCKSLTAATSKTGGAGARGKELLDLRLFVAWRLQCTKGVGKCRGTVDLLVPRVLARAHDLRVAAPKKRPVTCKGDCGERTPGDVVFAVVSGETLAQGKRGRVTRSIELDLRTTCGRVQTTKRLTFVFDDRGRVDEARSDLNGNDVPDGREDG